MMINVYFFLLELQPLINHDYDGSHDQHMILPSIADSYNVDVDAVSMNIYLICYVIYVVNVSFDDDDYYDDEMIMIDYDYDYDYYDYNDYQDIHKYLHCH